MPKSHNEREYSGYDTIEGAKLNALNDFRGQFRYLSQGSGGPRGVLDGPPALMPFFHLSANLQVFRTDSGTIAGQRCIRKM